MNTNDIKQGKDMNLYPEQGPKKSYDIDIHLNQIKEEDLRNYRMTRNFKWFLYVMIIFYALLMVVNPDPELKWNQRISGLCYVMAFALLAELFRRYNKDFREIDYSVTVAEMFEKAARRYQFGMRRMLQVIPSVLLIDAGLSISGYSQLMSFDFLTRVLIVQAFYIPVMLLAGITGYLVWKIRQKPLRDKALEILKELKEP